VYQGSGLTRYPSVNGPAAAAPAAWILAFNAGWEAALIDHGFCGYATIALVRHHQEDYLSLSWHWSVTTPGHVAEFNRFPERINGCLWGPRATTLPGVQLGETDNS